MGSSITKGMASPLNIERLSTIATRMPMTIPITYKEATIQPAHREKKAAVRKA